MPVDLSLAILREVRAGLPGGLSELLIEGGDHRCQVGDPPALPDSYHAGLAGWIARHT